MKVLIKNNTIRVTFISWWEMEDDVDKTRFNTSDRFLLNFLEKIFDCKTEIVSNNDVMLYLYQYLMILKKMLLIIWIIIILH